MRASDGDDVNGSRDSALKNKPKRCRIGSLFRAWSFQVTVKADLSQGASTQDKARLLTEHLSNRTAHSMHSIKTSFISVSTFCDESQLSGQPDSNGLVSILIRGYVQTKQATPISTMQKFFADASWKPVPGGLAGDAEFRANCETLAKLYVFGEIGLNNTGREEQKRAKQVGCYVPAVPAESDNRIILFASSILWKSFCANLWCRTVSKGDRRGSRASAEASGATGAGQSHKSAGSTTFPAPATLATGFQYVVWLDYMHLVRGIHQRFTGTSSACPPSVHCSLLPSFRASSVLPRPPAPRGRPRPRHSVSARARRGRHA